MLWIVVSLLCVGAAVWAAFQFKRTRSRMPLAVIAISVPLLAFSALQLSSNRPTVQPPVDLSSLTLEELEATRDIIAKTVELRKRLKNNPEDAKLWLVFAQTNLSVENYEEAVPAFQRAIDLGLNNADVHVQYAYALAALLEGVVGEPYAAAKKALEIDPEHKPALWFAADAAYEEYDLPQAIAYWERLAKLLPPDSEELKIVERNIVLTREEMVAAEELKAPRKQPTKK